MKFKPVPEPPDSIEALFAVRDAVPETPVPEADCCQLVVEHTSVAGERDVASDWLTFCRALELVDEFDQGYGQTDDSPSRELLAARFRDRVVLAESVAATVDTEPITAAHVFRRVRGEIPEWERRRAEDWEAMWTARVRRQLEWLGLFDEIERVDSGYRRTR